MTNTCYITIFFFFLSIVFLFSYFVFTRNCHGQDLSYIYITYLSVFQSILVVSYREKGLLEHSLKADDRLFHSGNSEFLNVCRLSDNQHTFRLKCTDSKGLNFLKELRESYFFFFKETILFYKDLTFYPVTNVILILLKRMVPTAEHTRQRSKN